MREFRRKMEALLSAYGVHYEVSHGSRHTMVEFYGLDGRRYKRQLDMSASDRRSLLNAKADLRRMLRQAGYQPIPLKRTSI